MTVYGLSLLSLLPPVQGFVHSPKRPIDMPSIIDVAVFRRLAYQGPEGRHICSNAVFLTSIPSPGRGDIGRDRTRGAQSPGGSGGARTDAAPNGAWELLGGSVRGYI